MDDVTTHDPPVARPGRLGQASILGLMGLVIACALVFAALKVPTPLGASLAFTAAMTAILVAALTSALDRSRVFSLGFLIFGGGYAYLAFAPGSADDMRPHLATTGALNALFDAMPWPNEPKWKRFDNFRYEARDDGFVRSYPSQGYFSFQRVGHSMAVVGHGIVGGLLALAIRRRDGRAEVPSSTARRA